MNNGDPALSFLWIDKLSLFFFLLILMLSTLILGLNHYYWHYPAVNYILDGTGELFFLLSFCMMGAFFWGGISSRLLQIFFYVVLYCAIIFLVMYATIAVQLTPFAPIDAQLLRMDRAFHYDTVMIMDKLSHYKWLRSRLCQAYNFVDIELLILPVLLIVYRQFYSIKEYFYLVLSTTLIGYSIYYFWPTMAPSSVLTSVNFFNEQLNTGYKFYQIHHHIAATSNTGGLISMPSFHIIWAILCQHSTWRVRWLWCVLLPLNILVILSALFLGWHYFVDFLGSILVIAIACGIAWYYKKITISEKQRIRFVESVNSYE